MYYEHKKHDGSLPLIGVDTFFGVVGKHIQSGEQELTHFTDRGKNQQVSNVEAFQEFHQAEAKVQLKKLQKVASQKKNTFAALMEASRRCGTRLDESCVYKAEWECLRNMWSACLSPRSSVQRLTLQIDKKGQCRATRLSHLYERI